MIKQIFALVRFLVHWREQGAPSLAWLGFTSRRMDNDFVRQNAVNLTKVTHEGDFQYVTVKGKIFVWPSRSPIESLHQFLSELLQEKHPHHYDTSLTPLKASDIVLDIGACEGGFSAFAAEKGARVISVEPSRFMSRVINRLFELRKLPAPQIVNCLLGEGATEAPFVDDPSQPGSSAPVRQVSEHSYIVPVLTLDEFTRCYLPEGLTFIKCDAEGWDAKILMSGTETLRTYKPKIAVTTYHNREDYQVVATFLKSLGYKCRGKGLLYFPHQAEYRTLMLHAWANESASAS